MKKLSQKELTQAIEKETGIPYVKIKNGGGYQYFYSNNDTVDVFLCSLSSHSHYVFRMSDLTVKEWVELFVQDLKDTFTMEGELEKEINKLIKKI